MNKRGVKDGVNYLSTPGTLHFGYPALVTINIPVVYTDNAMEADFLFVHYIINIIYKISINSELQNCAHYAKLLNIAKSPLNKTKQAGSTPLCCSTLAHVWKRPHSIKKNPAFLWQS